jgi:hypothetical protein
MSVDMTCRVGPNDQDKKLVTMKPPGLEQRGPLLSLVLFRWAALPLYSGVVGPFLIRGVWLPSRFGRCREPSILRCLGHNR